MEKTYLLNHPGVRKKILAGGTGPLPHFPPGTKTLLDTFERTVVDDSRAAGRPAEIFVGKMFKLEVWETLLTSMRVGEVAEFWCDAVHTGLYPIVSKGMRLIAQGKDPLEGQRHMCGMGNIFHYHSTGFPELDELMRTPQPLIFIMELLQVGDPMSYHRESWMMEKDEKLSTVPLLHVRGNALVKQRQFREAASKYKEAVLLLKTVQSREMPGDADYVNLGRMIVPLELNYCQCMLELHEYYEVIEHTDELLDKHKDCVKGYYKRAKAHAAVWNEKEARRDFNTVARLDATLASLVQRELRALSERIKEKYWQEKDAYWNKLSVAEAADGKNGDEVDEEEKEEEDGGDGDAGGEKTEEKDWQQMLRLVMLLQEQGNVLVKEKSFQEASEKFKEALDYVDALQNKVRPGDEDWESLEKVRLPLALNLSQCMLELQNYQQVVQLNDKLLESHQGHFKALYQRARAHVALRNEEEARRDLGAVEKLDPHFKPFVRRELKKMGENIRCVHAHHNKTYWDASREKWGPGKAPPKSVTQASADRGEGAEDENQTSKGEESNHENIGSCDLTVDSGKPDEEGHAMIAAAVGDCVASAR
ncbi:aryl-hydrocarbon-interacting protein-like 1 isoform X2 [Syngnathoides biaculeatus]|uniref:aryl-hydrocarbon-interacting protein-like 1 isoform X2 n=1 Tax=Syngnathoides biaculeatus TaxID=300417 RepID=UPI002ADE7135|nr:aryl-hydrocarbon-interacting protein-like 1 isoform X2 [Syngnathoides biaculeatus]